LRKSRSIEITSGKNGLPFIADAPAVAKPKLQYWDCGRQRWAKVAASFLRIELSQRILRCPLPGKFRGGVGGRDARDRGDT
jgi:hypothetical protein